MGFYKTFNPEVIKSYYFNINEKLLLNDIIFALVKFL